MVLIYYLFCFIFFMQIFMYAWYLSIQKVISLSLDLLIVYMKWCYSIILVSFIFPWQGISKIEWHQWSHPFIHQLTFCLVWHYCYSDDMDMLILFFFFFLSFLFSISRRDLLHQRKTEQLHQRKVPISLQVSVAINFTQILSFPE